MNLVIFGFIFVSIINRLWVKAYIQKFTGGKVISKSINDKEILDFIKSKTGLKLTKIIILNSKTIWGLMAGWPMRPYMIISKDAYEGFTKDELQWLLLHESGHYVLWHSGKMILLHIIFLAVGFLTLIKFNINLFFALLLGILFAVIYTQIARKFEIEANYFALSKMDNPKGLNGLYKKAQEKYCKNGRNRSSFWYKLFNVWNLDIYKDLASRATPCKAKVSRPLRNW